MVIDKHDKIYITSDTASIVKELEIEHPAAKILVMASERQVLLKTLVFRHHLSFLRWLFRKKRLEMERISSSLSVVSCFLEHSISLTLVSMPAILSRYRTMES